MAKDYRVVDICNVLLSFAASLCTGCVVNVTQDKRLMNSTFRTIENSRLYSCAAECVSYGICKSFNFEWLSRKCYLNYGNQDLYILGEDDNFIYSEVEDWQNTPLGPCRSTPCGVYERCLVKRNNDIYCVDIRVSLAQGKPATASSASMSGPGNAVDGRNTSLWGSCFHVNPYDDDPWWQVDLEDLYLILNVNILSRSDCCPERLHDFAVEIYKVDPTSQTNAELQLCYMYNDTVTQGGIFVPVTCTTPLSGRFVRISGKNKLNSDDKLQFCEVEVIGVKLI